MRKNSKSHDIYLQFPRSSNNLSACGQSRHRQQSKSARSAITCSHPSFSCPYPHISPFLFRSCPPVCMSLGYMHNTRAHTTHTNTLTWCSNSRQRRSVSRPSWPLPGPAYHRMSGTHSYLPRALPRCEQQGHGNPPNRRRLYPTILNGPSNRKNARETH